MNTIWILTSNKQNKNFVSATPSGQPTNRRIKIKICPKKYVMKLYFAGYFTEKMKFLNKVKQRKFKKQFK